jgi:hypothetical protein
MFWYQLCHHQVNITYECQLLVDGHRTKTQTDEDGNKAANLKSLPIKQCSCYTKTSSMEIIFLFLLLQKGELCLCGTMTTNGPNAQPEMVYE